MLYYEGTHSNQDVIWSRVNWRWSRSSFVHGRLTSCSRELQPIRRWCCHTKTTLGEIHGVPWEDRHRSIPRIKLPVVRVGWFDLCTSFFWRGRSIFWHDTSSETLDLHLVPGPYVPFIWKFHVPLNLPIPKRWTIRHRLSLPGILMQCIGTSYVPVHRATQCMRDV